MGISDLPLWIWPTAASLLIAVGAGVIKAFRSYRSSLTRDVESFGEYVWGHFRFGFIRYVSSTLTRRLGGIRKYATMRLRMFPTHLIVPSVDDAQISIDTAYVQLSLSGLTSQRISDESLLVNDPGSVLIFGEPGSGKSSLTKKLFRRSCLRAYTAPAASRLPIHAELRSLGWASVQDDTDPGNWLYQEVLRQAVGVRGVHNPTFIVESAANDTGLIVLLDGLDEVPEDRVPFATKAIVALTADLRGRSSATMVVTTARSQLRGRLSRDFLGSMTATYSIEPFSPSDIFEFLRKWPYPIDPLGEAQRIFSTIQEHRTLADMCTNPLILSMYVAQDQRYTRSENLHPVRLPDTRTEFYRSVIGELLLHRRQQQLGMGPGGTDSRRQREELLGRIALDHLYRSGDPANSISWKDATATTRSIAGLNTDAEAENYLRFLALDTGIFSEERIGESMRFMHLTLCEYLAAKELTESRQPSISKLIDRATGPQPELTPGFRLWEVIVFAVSLLGRADRLDALAELRQREVEPELVVRTARECQTYTAPAFAECVQSIVQRLVAIDVADWDDSWFGRVRLLVGCFSDPAYGRQVLAGSPAHVDVGSLLSTLTADDPARRDKLFDLWLRTSPAEALSFTSTLELGTELWANSRVADAMEQPELTAFAISRFYDSPAQRITWAFLLAEAGLRNNLVAETLVRERLRPEAAADPGLRWRSPWTSSKVAAKTVYGAVLGTAIDNLPAVNSARHRSSLARVELLTAVKSVNLSLATVCGRGSAAPARTATACSLVVLSSVLVSVATLSLLPLGIGAAFSYVALLAVATLHGGTRQLSEPGTKKTSSANPEASRAILNLGRFRLPQFPADIRHAVATVHGRTVLYSRYPPDLDLVARLRPLLAALRPLPVATLLRLDTGQAGDVAFPFTAIDLRGLSTQEAASHLLAGAFPFTATSELDLPPVPLPPLRHFWRVLILTLPRRFRGPVVLLD